LDWKQGGRDNRELSKEDDVTDRRTVGRGPLCGRKRGLNRWGRGQLGPRCQRKEGGKSLGGRGGRRKFLPLEREPIGLGEGREIGGSWEGGRALWEKSAVRTLGIDEHFFSRKAIGGGKKIVTRG